MKRQAVIRRLLSTLTDTDVAVFSGDDLCKEAFQYDRDGFFYLPDIPGFGSSLALGMSMNTDKRVFMFVNDGEFLKSFNTVPQMAVSGCKNLFYIILVSGFYQSAGGSFTVFKELKAPKGFMFNLGFSVFDYTSYFRDRMSMAKIPLLIERIRGPMALFIHVDKGINRKLEDIPYSNTELCDRIIRFIQNKELKTSLFAPPSLVSQE